MTEDEAKTKWCPMAKGPWVETVNRGRATEDCLCIASACMAWRWLPLMADDAYAEAVKKAANDIGDKSERRHKAAKHVNANRTQYGLPDKPFRGYCGLAGEPRA